MVVNTLKIPSASTRGLKLQLKVTREVFRSSTAGVTRNIWTQWLTAPRSPAMGDTPSQGKLGSKGQRWARSSWSGWSRWTRVGSVGQSSVCAARRAGDISFEKVQDCTIILKDKCQSHSCRKSLMLQGHPGVAELQEQTWPRDTSSVLQHLPVPKTSVTLQINPGWHSARHSCSCSEPSLQVPMSDTYFSTSCFHISTIFTISISLFGLKWTVCLHIISIIALPISNTCVSDCKIPWSLTKSVFSGK